MNQLKQFKKEMLTIISTWREKPKKHNSLDELLGSIIYFTKKRKDDQDLLIFKNKYICADAVLVSVYYVAERLRLEHFSEKTINDFIANAVTAISKIFDIEYQKIKEIEPERRKFFEPFYADKNINAVVEEAELMFSHEYNEEGFVHYDEQSPLMLLGIEERFKITQETVIFFKNMFDILANSINSILA